MRIAAILVALCVAGEMASAAATPNSWQKLVSERLPQFGHRNWIVVADSAYPAQSREGIETVVVDADQLTVLRGVMNLLAKAKHVAAEPLLDQELQYLSDQDVVGMDAFRQQVKVLLNGRPVQELPHEQIISKLDAASQTFRVLIIKTNSTLPYTSVFLQLGCAYWPPEAEKKLRERMLKTQK